MSAEAIPTDAAARARRIVRTSFVGIAANDRAALRQALLADLAPRFPNRTFTINFDTDYSD